jgi:uncharacterized membrane protein
MRAVEFSVNIDRPLEEVYKYTTDIKHLPEWGEGIIACEMITDGPIDIGSIFIVKNKMGGRVQEFQSKVISIKPNTQFGFQTDGGMMSYKSTRTFEVCNGSTLITESIDADIPGVMKLLSPLLMRMVRNSHYKSLLKLKEILES